MRRSLFGLGLAAMMLGGPIAVGAAAPQRDQAMLPAGAPVRRVSRNERLRSLGWYKPCRSRWKAVRPKKRSNRLHVSARTRRKHRRARRAA